MCQQPWYFYTSKPVNQTSNTALVVPVSIGNRPWKLFQIEIFLTKVLSMLLATHDTFTYNKIEFSRTFDRRFPLSPTDMYKFQQTCAVSADRGPGAGFVAHIFSRVFFISNLQANRITMYVREFIITTSFFVACYFTCAYRVLLSLDIVYLLWLVISIAHKFSIEID